MHIDFTRTRQNFIVVLFGALFILLFTRLTYIQVIRHKFLSDLASQQHKILIKLEPSRGNIYDRQERLLGVYLDTASLYAVPKEIKDKEKFVRTLATVLDLDQESLLRRLKRDNYFTWIKRKVDSRVVEKVMNRRLKGVYLSNESKRFYPGGRLACHVLGITNIDNKGLEGIELYYNRELAGETGLRRSLRDAKKREIVSFETDFAPVRNGKSLVLTIDEVIQHVIEAEIENIVRLYSPEAISVVALDPRTGEILGLANYPSFDPNLMSEINEDFVRNRSISDSFEPGSVFKVVTASAALEEGVVDFDSEFFCENGLYKVGKRTLHDYKPYGTLKFRDIIEKSSNIGTAKVADKLGKEKLGKYIKKFNFGQPTGVDLPGEISGIMRESSNWSYVDMMTIPMGQGIAVTALQLGSCVSAIANDGILMRPYIVKEILNEEGLSIRENKPKVIRRVISKGTADKVKELLEGVVERGTGKQARLDNFRACGKTGTAQKVSQNGGYYSDKFVASFIGFAPFDKPRVSLVICVDEPRGKHFGSQVAAPAFKNIMEKILYYMTVESDRNEIKKAS